jgi:Domain of unknown function (DUF3471).
MSGEKAFHAGRRERHLPFDQKDQSMTKTMAFGLLFLLAVPFGASAQSMQSMTGVGDNEIMARLRNPANAVSYGGTFAKVMADKGTLSARELDAFGKLLDVTVIDLDEVLHTRFGMRPNVDFPIEVFVTRGAVISHVSFSDATHPQVFFWGAYVKGRVAPYDHELVHALSGSEDKSQWMVESWANYVASLLPTRDGAYESPLFLNQRNRVVDSWAKSLLEREQNKQRLALVFLPEWPLKSLPRDEDRQLFRAFSYVASHSFTKFLAEKIGPERMGQVYTASDTVAAIPKVTGKSPEQWREEWLTHLQRVSPRRSLPPDRIPVYVGCYEGPAPMGTLSITREGDTLYSQKPGGTKFELVWVGGDRFRTMMGFVEVNFRRGRSGQVETVSYRHFDGTRVIGKKTGML